LQKFLGGEEVLTCKDTRLPVESGTYDAPIYLSEMVQSTAPIYGIASGSAPLFTYQVNI
jgi:hypothetical protein